MEIFAIKLILFLHKFRLLCKKKWKSLSQESITLLKHFKKNIGLFFYKEKIDRDGIYGVNIMADELQTRFYRGL